MKNFNVNDQGFYGRFGGAYVPEILHANVEKLRECYLREMEDESFQQEFRLLLRDYVGRPSPLYYARRLSEKYGTRIYLKREDLNHTGAHKINNTIGQILLARRMGKTRIIADVKSGRVRNSVLCDPNFPACFYPECDRTLSVNMRNNLNNGAISLLLS